MTATRDRRSDPELDAEPAWDDRPIFGQFRGLPWWGAVLLAFVPTAIAAFVDMQRQENTLGKIYQIVFVVSCLVAVCLVRRRSLFGPVVQPPLVFAITAIGAVALLSEKGGGGGLKALVISIALPLTSNFPTMGITTAIVVAIGLYRWWRERDPDPAMRPNRSKADRPARDGAVALDDEPGQGTGGRSLRDRAAAAPAARRGRPEPDEPPERGRRTPGRTPRPGREPSARDAVRESGREPSARDSGREPKPGRREPAAGRAERAERAGRVEPPAEGARGRGRGRPADPQPRRREPGGDGGRGREDRPARRDSDREGRERQPRRRPPDDDR